ncbi:MAG: hypothetical protein WCW35_01595 [Bacteroidota bacterium]
MKKYFYLLLAAVMFALPLLSQDKDEEGDEQDEDSGRRSYSYWNRSKLGGAGGFTPIVGMFDNKEIDKYLTGAGLPSLGSDPIYLIGGEGYGYIMFLRNVRMGGFGVSGHKTVSAVQAVTAGGNVKKEVDYSVSYGGFLIDYVQPIAYRLDVSFGASIGGGAIGLTMRRDDGNFKDWNNLWNEYGNVNTQSTNYTRRITGGFAVFNPRVNIEYTLLTWMQIRIGAGYPIMFSPEWKLDDKYDIEAVPSKIKTNGYTVNAGVMFGFFGW